MDAATEAATMPAADQPDYERTARSLPEDLLYGWRADRVSDVERADARRVEELRALCKAADRAVTAEIERCHTYTPACPRGPNTMTFAATPMLARLVGIAEATREALTAALFDYREISDVTPGPLLVDLLHVRIRKAGGSKEWCSAAKALTGARFSNSEIRGVLDGTAQWLQRPFDPMWERLVVAMQVMDAARRQAAA